MLDDGVATTSAAVPPSAGLTRELAVAGVTGTNVPTGATRFVVIDIAAGATGRLNTVFPNGFRAPSSANVYFGSGPPIRTLRP